MVTVGLLEIISRACWTVIVSLHEDFSSTSYLDQLRLLLLLLLTL